MDRVPFGLVFRSAIAAALGVLVVLIACYAVYLVRDILVLVAVALFVAVSLEPVVDWLTKRGSPRWLAVALIVLALLSLVGAFAWSIAPSLTHEGSKLISDLPGYLERLSAKSSAIRHITDRYHLTDRLSALATDLPAKLSGGAVGFLHHFIGALAATVTVLALSIYFMADMPRLRRGVPQLFPPRHRTRATEIVDIVAAKVGGYMFGNIVVSLIAGSATFVCLEVLGVPFALPLAVVVGITDLIPIIGATLGAIACLVVALFTVGFWPACVVLVAFFLAYQAVETYLLVPRVLHNAVDLSSVTVLLCALTGGTLAGLIGALMSIPIAAAVKVILSPRVAALYESATPDGEPAPT